MGVNLAAITRRRPAPGASPLFLSRYRATDQPLDIFPEFFLHGIEVGVEHPEAVRLKCSGPARKVELQKPLCTVFAEQEADKRTAHFVDSPAVTMIPEGVSQLPQVRSAPWLRFSDVLQQSTKGLPVRESVKP